MKNLSQLLDNLIAWAEKQPEILAVYLYGSQAHGQSNLLSDVDIGILARDNIYARSIYSP